MKRVLFLISVMAFSLVAGCYDVFAQTPRSGGTFNFVAPYGGDFVTLDPHHIRRTQDEIFAMQFTRGLYVWDTQENKPVLNLADKVTISPDGKNYVYNIKKNIKSSTYKKLIL